MKKLAVLLVLFLCTGCAKTSPQARTELIFDTPVTIAVYDQKSDDVLTQAFLMCRDLDQQYSKTKAVSEVSILNEMQGNPYEASDELIQILELSIKYSKLTNGLFDITTYKLTELWDFKNTNPKVPSQEDINNTLASTGYENIIIDGNYVTLLNGAKIDLGGVVKGYAADEVRKYLIQSGVKNATISIGGNIIAIGNKGNNENWTVGVRDPFAGENVAIMSLEVEDLTVVTSGPYERNFVIDGITYHHILDPKTGYPSNSDIISVTIITETSVVADLLSTSTFLMGIEDGMELIESIEETEAIFIDFDGNFYTSSGIGDTIKVNYLK